LKLRHFAEHVKKLRVCIFVNTPNERSHQHGEGDAI